MAQPAVVYEECVTDESSWDADEALTAVYTAHYTSLVRLGALLLRDTGTAEEIVQDAFVAMHGRWHRLRDPHKALAYLRTAVVNRCRSWLRRQRTARAHVPAPAEEVGLGADELWDALATLGDRHRTAIVLRFYEDMPDDLIAAALVCRPATVRTLVRRGLHALRKEIEP